MEELILSKFLSNEGNLWRVEPVLKKFLSG
jgi:hypothetical protein